MANILSVAGPGSKYQLPGANPAGFWAGLWHGMIAGITFIVSVLNPNVRIYEKNNRGRLYDLGFIIGAGVYATHSGTGDPHGIPKST
jgi:hypothetical protein